MNFWTLKNIYNFSTRKFKIEKIMKLIFRDDLDLQIQVQIFLYTKIQST